MARARVIDRLRDLACDIMMPLWANDRCFCRLGPIGSRLCDAIDRFVFGRA